MKKIILSVIVMLLSFSASSQTEPFSISELIKMNEYNFDDFDTYILKKGFQFVNLTVKDEVPTQRYEYLERRKNETAIYTSCSLTKIDEKNSVLVYAFGKQSDFLKFKQELDLEGFVFVNSEENSGYLSYKKDTKTVSLKSKTITLSNDQKRILYSIVIKNF